MFQCLFGMFVSSLVIFLPVMRGGNTVRMCGKVVEFGSALVRVLWHSFPALGGRIQLRIVPTSILFNIEQSASTGTA